MLRAEVLGAMKIQSPTRLHQQFAHYQLRATEAAYSMSLQWEEAARANAEFERERSEFLKEKDKFKKAKSSIGTSMQMLREERESALARKDKTLKKIEDLLGYNEKLICDHVASEMKLKSQVEKAAFDSEKLNAEISETRSLLENCLVEKEKLNSQLVLDENSAASAVEDFKESNLFDNLPEDEEDLGAEEEEDDASEGSKDI
ncbi:hypothetical protein LIER_33844 [Lithospermum erythrorhizon]|uniref:Uncharacterized protein n=1 Tax=Lithospermum erythrorhizon TaxID=34254 RepID=A0AAV3S2Q0_LITER